MATFKCTHIFQGGNAGWSESFYVTANSIEQAYNRFAPVRPVRQAMLGVGSLLVGVRVSNVAILNDSIVNFYGPDQAVYPAKRDTIGASVLVRLEATDKSRRMMWIRGIPDSWIDIDVTTSINKLPSTAGTAISNWVKELIKDPAIQLNCYDKTAQGATGVPSTAVPVAAGNYTTFTAANVTAIVGNKVLMRGWKGPDRAILNGTYDVVNVTATTVTLDVPFALLTDPAHDFGGKLYPRNKGYFGITSGVYEKSGIKRAGRAFFVPAGRRRAAR